MEAGIGQLKNVARKHLEPVTFTLVEELEKEIVKHANQAKQLFDDRAVKVVTDQYKYEVKKVSNGISKCTRDYHVSC